MQDNQVQTLDANAKATSKHVNDAVKALLTLEGAFDLARRAQHSMKVHSDGSIVLAREINKAITDWIETSKDPCISTLIAVLGGLYVEWYARELQGNENVEKAEQAQAQAKASVN